MKSFLRKTVVGLLIISIVILQAPIVSAEEPAATSTSETANDVVTPSASTTPESSDPLSPSPEESAPVDIATTTATTTPSEPTDTSVSTTNTGTVENTATTTAETGNNVAAGMASSTGTTTIETGNALALSNVVNVVNVNLINSDALIAFLNGFASGNENIDLRSLEFGFDGFVGCSQCILSTSTLPANQSITASSTNDAVISNALVVRSSTGSNTASSTGATYIDTGDAYANANVVNVANTNLIDSRYVMLILNNFGTLSGDLVLPNASFFDRFLTSSIHQSTAPVLTVNATNTAVIDDGVSTSADTGNNIATSTGGSAIQTGTSFAGSTILNDVNSNHVGGTSIALVFRVFGSWTGKAFNVPTSFMWNNTPVGIQFVSIPNDSGGYSNGTTTISNTNSALINNSISVEATTGGNQASGSDTAIRTGNAYANANIVNIANTNAYGRNWINAIINIFGDWNGNVSFGQPDLWVGTRAEFVGGDNGPGSRVVYSYTIKNNGDAPAHHITLDHNFGSSLIKFPETGGNMKFDIGTLAPGEVREVSGTAQVSADLMAGDTALGSTITVNADESDANNEDNSDTITVIARRIGSITVYPTLNEARFEIAKTNNATSTITASSTVDYTITIRNTEGFTPRATLVDEIKDETGRVIHAEHWDLDNVASGEEIIVTYSAFFSASTTPGVYTNTAQVRSYDHSFPDSALATSTITITAYPHTKKSLGTSLKPRPLLAEARVATSTEIATTSATIHDDDVPTSLKSAQLANVWSALGPLSSWLWLLLLIILIGTGIYAVRPREIEQEIAR